MIISLGHFLTNIKSRFLTGAFIKVLAILRLIYRSRSFSIFIAIAATISVIATYITLTKSSASNHNGDVDAVYWLLNLDIVLLLLLGAIIARRVAKVWIRRKQGVAGAQLHAKFVFIFGLLAAVPAILMAIFSAVFFYFGIQSWFNDRVQVAVNESLHVAQAYLKEHQNVMKADILAMANDMNREAAILQENVQAMNRMVQTQSQLRNLPEIVLFTSTGEVIARSNLAFLPEIVSIPDDVLKKARNGDVALLTNDGDNRIRAIVALNGFIDTFLFVGRMVDRIVLQHIETTEKAVAEYTALDGRRSQMQLSMTLLFMAVSFLLLLAAVWAGFYLADSMTKPIADLIKGSERLRSGDLSVRIEETGKADELDILAKSFNRMTSQMQRQRDELVSTNRVLDERRRFTEAVLSGASSGVLGLNTKGEITLANTQAAKLLDCKKNDLVGQALLDILPEATPLFNGTTDKKQLQINIPKKKDAGLRTLLIKVTAQSDDSDELVITFDDISALVTAERKAAWSDVARRIAHEIKNPLTPIQLSAERLKRKYLKQITKEPEIFVECTDTIVRQVKEIGRMVNSFSSFARMPEPIKQAEDLIDICKDSIVLQQQAHTDITIETKYPRKKDIQILCDRGQIGQILTNLLQNSIDAIHDAKEKNGHIILQIKHNKKANEVAIIVEDNGLGLPKKTQQELLEPYTTTKQKGSGLGLAIVKKILEDHDGFITLNNRSKNIRGTNVEIRLPLHLEDN